MHIRSLLAGVGLTAVAVVVPLVAVSTASADDGADPTSAASCPGLEMRQAITDFLSTHPEVVDQRAEIRELPPEDRRDAWQAYLDAHPDVAADTAVVREELREQWWEIVGNAAATVHAYPELHGLLDRLADAPVGDRQAVAREYLADRPEARAALQDVRQENADRRLVCRSGG